MKRHNAQLLVLVSLILCSCTTIKMEKVIESAKQGDAQAQFELALMYENGKGVSENTEQAMKWYRSAAESGHLGALVDLGWFYQQGQYVEQNIERAVGFYTQAANQGNAQAQLNLGVIYDEGIHVIEDDKKAIYWYEKAAAQGNEIARLNLGINYWKGEGVERSYEKAWRILNNLRMNSENLKVRWRARSALNEIKSELGRGHEQGEFSFPNWENLN